jgi:hypothetical protein
MKTGTVEEVRITARNIVRKADRFVVNVENNPTAIGKNGLEMVAVSPGVWVGEDYLSINGRRGTRLMIDDRMVEGDFDELKRRLQAIRAEDIRRIEVIPMSGADHDANTSAGIIAIYLRRQRDDGFEGNVSTRYSNSGRYGYSLSPSAGLNYRRGPLSLYSSVNGWHGRGLYTVDGVAEYVASGVRNFSDSQSDHDYRDGNARLGAIYDLAASHSIGMEGYLKTHNDDSRVSSRSDNRTPVGADTHFTDNRSSYRSHARYPGGSMTANYIWQLDTLGSVFKVIGSWNSHSSTSDVRSHNKYLRGMLSNPAAAMSGDSLYANTSGVDYNMFNVTADLDYKFDDKNSFKAGTKFYNSRMFSDQFYEGLDSRVDPAEWRPVGRLNFSNDYVERIAAAYAILTTTLWEKIDVVSGLRGEQTFFRPRTV